MRRKRAGEKDRLASGKNTFIQTPHKIEQQCVARRRVVPKIGEGLPSSQNELNPTENTSNLFQTAGSPSRRRENTQDFSRRKHLWISGTTVGQAVSFST